MTDLPFDLPGQFWRGNLHTHSDRSDGFTTLIGAELHAPRTEAGQAWHIVAVGLPLDFTPPGGSETGPELARRARTAGAFVGMAHPSASLLSAVDAESLDAAHSVEVYNALADRENRGVSWHLTDVLPSRGRHCRITVEDATGARAWTNPIHIPPQPMS